MSVSFSQLLQENGRLKQELSQMKIRGQVVSQLHHQQRSDYQQQADLMRVMLSRVSSPGSSPTSQRRTLSTPLQQVRAKISQLADGLHQLSATVEALEREQIDCQRTDEHSHWSTDEERSASPQSGR